MTYLSLSACWCRVSSRGGAGGKLPPQTAQLPPQKKKRRKEKRGREREKEGEGEREREGNGREVGGAYIWVL